MALMGLVAWGGMFFSSEAVARVQFKANKIELTAEARKPFNVPLRDLLSDEGTGNLTWFVLDPTPDWLNVDLAGETMSGTPSLSDAGSRTFRMSVQDGDSGGLAEITVRVLVVPVFTEDPINLGQLPERTPFSLDLRTKVDYPGAGQLQFELKDPAQKPGWLNFTTAGMLSGTPARKDIGAFGPFTVIVRAPGGGTDEVDVLGEVIKVIQPPQWKEDPITLPDAQEDFAYSKAVADMVNNPEGEALSFRIVSGAPASGWLTLSTAGTFSGTPAKQDVTVQPLQMQVEVSSTIDGQKFTDTAVFRLTVLETNHAPEWTVDPIDLGDAYTWVEFSKDLTQYVTDLENDALTFRIVSGPSWAQLSQAGAFTGTPDRPHIGPNTWMVEVSDGEFQAQATVKVNVIKSNEPPRWLQKPTVLPNAQEDFAYTENLKSRVMDPDNDPVTFTLVDGPAWLNLTPEGVLSGTPGAGDLGLNKLRIKVADGIAGEDIAEVHITVDHTNHDPSWKEDPIRITVPEKAPMNENIAPYAVDSDAQDTLRFFKLSGPSWARLSTEGVFTGTPQSQHLGDHTFRVRVDDQNGGTADVTVIITVTNVNDPPRWTQNPIRLPDAPERSPYSSDVAPFAMDEDPGDTLTFAKVDGPAWASFGPDGKVSGTPQRPDLGLNKFTVKVTDAAGASANVTVEIEVIHVNLPPEWTQNPIDLADATEDRPYSFNLAPFARDEDNDPLTFSKISGPSWLAVAANGMISGTPPAGSAGAYTAVFEVSDGQATARVDANGRVLMKNYPPSLDQQNLSFQVKERATLQVDLNDPKYVNDPNNDRLLFSLIAPVDWIQLSADGDLFLAPQHKHVGTHKVRFRVSDGELVAEADLNIEVLRDPRAPQWTQDPIRFTTLARTPFEASIADKAKELDGVPLTFSKKSGPGWLTVGADGKLSGTPQDGDVGDNTFVVTARNDALGADVTVIITVLEKNYPPEIKEPALTFTVKERENFQVSLNDPQYIEDRDGDGLVFTLLDQVEWLSLSSNGDLFINPLHEHIGDHQFRFRVTDGQDPVEGTITVKVIRDPRAPNWLMDPIRFTAVARKLFRASVEDKVRELDGVPLTFEKKSGPGWLSVDETGNLSGTPQDADIGDNEFVVTARNDALGADVTVIITILQGNQDPYWTQNPVVLPKATAGVPYNQNVAPFAKDPDNDPLTFSKIDGPDWLNFATNGQAVGTPGISDLGLNEFTVRVQDPDGAFADVKVHVHVEKPNTPPRWLEDPIMLADAYTLTSYQFDVAPFAEDADGDILTFQIVTGPDWLSMSSDGLLTGVPQPEHIGDYTAVFEVSDGKATAQVAAIGRVFRKNDPPSIDGTKLRFTMKEREKLEVNLADPQYVQDPDGDTLTFSLVDTAPWVALSQEGVLVLTPQYPQIGSHEFRFTVSDGKLSAEGTIYVEVLRDPRPPQWQENPIRFTAVVRVPFEESVADKIRDLDGLAVTITKKSGPSWLSVSPNGLLSGTPQDPDLGENPFVLTARNDVLGADVTVIIDVVTDNKPPYWTQDPIRLPDGNPGTTYAESVASYAKDPENERLTFEKISGPDWAFITTSGLIIGTPTEADVGMSTLGVRVKDPHGAFADATIQIVIGGEENNPPYWTQNPINLGQAPIDVVFNFDLTQYVKDDDGDSLTFRKISGPAWLFVSTGGQISGIPRMVDLGDYTAEFEVTDGRDSARVSAYGKVVDTSNKPPQLKPEALSFIVKERQEFKVNLNQPQYVEDPDGDPLTWELLTPADWVTLTPEGDLTLKPLHEHIGDHSFRVRVTDTEGLSAEGPMLVRVIPDPRPPIWLEDPIRFEATAEKPFSETLADKVRDLDGLPLTFSKKSGPAWLNVATDGTLSGTPQKSDIGENTFIVTVRNPSLGADATVIITVKPAGGPIVDEIIADEAVPGAPAENLWVIDNSWPWIGKNWLIDRLSQNIHIYFQALDNAQIHHTGVYISADPKRWKAIPIPDDKGLDLMTWRDTDVPRSFRYRLARTKTDNCYNSPVWSMFQFYLKAPQLDIYHNGFFTENVPMDVMIVTKHRDTYRYHAQNTAQRNWIARDYARNFIDFHNKEKQSYRISALAPECPRLLDPHEGNPAVKGTGAENPYKVLTDETKGVYYPWDCNIDVAKVLRDYAQRVIFRAYVHAKHRIPLSKTPTDPSTIKVSLGGVALPGNTGSQNDKWSYDSARNEVVIYWNRIDLSQVRPGDRIRIEYIGG